LTDVFEGTLIGVLVTTADRRFVAHTAVNTRIDQSKGTVPGFSVISNTVIFRRTEDLSIVWSRELEAGNSRAERIAVSPDGKLVAVAVSGMTGPTSGRGHIEILNGPDGAQILRVPLFGGDGIALSPRGTVLAVGRISGERRGSILAADLYELSSMRKLATVEHDQWSKGRDLLHTTGFDNDGLQFTADGRHLLTSINGLVKVWRLQS
jgi:WD40 repeat protein